MNNTTQESARRAVPACPPLGRALRPRLLAFPNPGQQLQLLEVRRCLRPSSPLPPQPPQAEFPSNRARIVSRHLGTRLELPIEAADHPASSSPFPSPSPRISCTSASSTVASKSSASRQGGNNLGSVLPDLSIPNSSSQRLSDLRLSGSERNCFAETTNSREDPR